MIIYNSLYSRLRCHPCFQCSTPPDKLFITILHIHIRPYFIFFSFLNFIILYKEFNTIADDKCFAVIGRPIYEGDPVENIKKIISSAQ